MFMENVFLKALQEIRESVDRPFVLTSAYRCANYNLEVGGKLSSRHTIGMAVDISTKGWRSDDLHYLMFELTSYHCVNDDYNTGIGIYRKHIHFDFRLDQESMWINL
jgi:uncharacterized protein YcbK (DUF882 family)